MKFVRSLIISFLAMGVTIMTVYGGYTIYAASTYSFEKMSTYFSIRTSYHNEMNDFFNAKIGKLVEILEDKDGGKNTDPFKDKRLLTPKSEEECTEDNLSTFCVAVQGLDMYLKYIKVIEAIKLTLPERDDILENYTYSLMMNLTRRRNEDIDKEVTDARKVYEATLSAYNEFRLAYPMHKEYEKILTGLSKYLTNMKTIRREIREFPLRFIDASTIDCE